MILYGIRYALLGNMVVSPVSEERLAIAVCKSWRRKIHPDAKVVTSSDGQNWEDMDIEYEK